MSRTPGTAPPRTDYPWTDIGNAAAFADQHAERLLWVDAWNHWLLWNGHAWKRDEDLAVMRAARATVARLEAMAMDHDDPTVQAAHQRHAKGTAAASRLTAMVTIGRSDPALAARPGDFDKDAHLLATTGQVVDLRTGETMPPDPARRLMRACTTPFDAEALAPHWRNLIDWAFSGELDLIEWFQRAVGCSLFGDQREHAFFFCFGSGRNGKSTILSAIRDALGDYATVLPPDFLVLRKFPTHPTELTSLKGVRLALGSELDPSAQLDEARVKALTGNEPIKARFMHGDFFEIRPTWKLWLAGNHKPRVRGTDAGIWRRVKLVPFLRTVEHEDKDLPAKLRAEAPGILKWCIDGAMDWHCRGGLGACEAVDAASAEYRRGEDTIGMFFEECCRFDKDLEQEPYSPSSVTIGAMRSAIGAWAEANGYHAPAPRAVAERLESLGIIQSRTSSERRWRGVALVGTAPERPGWSRDND